MFDVEVLQHNCNGIFSILLAFFNRSLSIVLSAGNTAGNYRHTSGIVPTELMPFKRRKQNCLYMGEAEFALLTVDVLKQQWVTGYNK